VNHCGGACVVRVMNIYLVAAAAVLESVVVTLVAGGTAADAVLIVDVVVVGRAAARFAVGGARVEAVVLGGTFDVDAAAAAAA
jgi:hypothetical protein